MISLHGFSVSNYHNKVKLALLEKGVPFQEVHAHPRHKDAAHLAASPLGKVPYIVTEQGSLCESQAILDYLEAAFPEPALLPADPFAAAKVRELVIFIDLHLELVARELYVQAFFGGRVEDQVADRVRAQLVKNIAAFATLAKFDPFVAGDRFTQADCSAWVSLPLVGLATKAVYGSDLLADAGISLKAYKQLIGERPSAKRVDTDRRAEQQRMQAQASKP